MKENTRQKEHPRGLRVWGRGFLWGICALLGLAVCATHLLPYYSLWAEADPISYGWEALSLAMGSPVLLAAAVCSVLIGRLWLKGFSFFTTAALIFANLTILYLLLCSLFLQLLPIAKAEPVLLADHISAVISILPSSALQQTASACSGGCGKQAGRRPSLKQIQKQNPMREIPARDFLCTEKIIFRCSSCTSCGAPCPLPQADARRGCAFPH